MDPALRIATGRAWQRLHLWATSQGLAMQPLNQTVERRDRELQLGVQTEIGTALDALAGGSDRQSMMPFRIGYPEEKALKSPRRAASEVIVGNE